MISVTPKFRASAVEGKEGKIVYQVILNRVVRQIATPYRLFSNEWNDKEGCIHFPINNKPRAEQLLSVANAIEEDLKTIRRIVSEFVYTMKPFTLNDVVKKFKARRNRITLFCYMESHIARLKRYGQVRTSEAFASTLNSFRTFRHGVDLPLEELDADLLLEYEAYLCSKHLAPNTISFYMRRLRTVYNRAADEGLLEQRFIFRKVFTAMEKTTKRAVSLRTIRKIASLKIEYQPDRQLARDLFLFSFYTRGMSFVDIAYLQKSDISNGILTYRRKKTGQVLHIQWEKCMQELVDRNPAPIGSPYLFPIITNLCSNSRKQYLSMLTKVNTLLKQLGKELHLRLPLTTYVARHSWASIARREGIPLSVISKGMGHNSECTTQIYLASLDSQLVDRANRKILNLLH